MNDLTELEKELKKVYKQASDEMRKKAAKYFTQFKKEDEEMRKALEEGRIKAKEYKQWRQIKMATGQNYKAMINSLTNDMTNANKIAASIINGYTPEAYAYGINFATYQIETGISMSTAWALYDRMTVERMWRENPDLIPWKARVDIPKDKLWNKTHINGAIMQSVLQGESIPETAKRLKQVAEMNNRQAVRTARTAMTACENAGRIDSYKRASGMGIKMKKQWLATMDSRVRDSHAWLDGMSIPINDTFPNGCEYPADPSGAPEEVYNCRCTLIADIEGIDQGTIDDKTLRPSEMLEKMTYDEWKESHKKPEWMQNKSRAEKQDKPVTVGDTGAAYTKSQVDKMNTLLQKADSLIQDIWRAAEPNLKRTWVPSSQDKARAFYRRGQRRVYLVASNVAKGSAHQTAFQAHFHEFAHNIDDMFGDISTSWLSDDFKTFEEVIMAELTEKFAGTTGSVDKEAVMFFIEEMKMNYSLRDRSDLSDIMEKFTVSTIGVDYPLGVGHGEDYALRKGNTSKESFADIFSADIANQGSIELIKQELPKTYGAFRSMLEEVIELMKMD